ncbi:helix-turn-helix domain-containing protein [Bordetella genomosp. 9]|uniref:HTH araC/xylS-type domain-containing protein n=1 Tax=Bordetella genomosp. 9 TaxID=1416803 RepID=A0A1W6Z1Q1_9BORD|nr:AraC family transcriptional regulator [Bordetella genomosp. 9]ARP87029.1 hypothetical protein CAL13_13040 [Bordetella genomosp. 9]
MTGRQLSIRQYQEEVRLHRHDFHQIVLPRAGVLHLDIEGRGGMVAQGRGAFIAAGCDHAFRAHGRNAFVVLDVGNAHGDPPDVDRPPFFTFTPALQHLLDYLEALPMQNDVPASLHGPWSALMLQALGANGKPADDPGARVIERALGMMRRHLDRDLSVADIARGAGASTARIYQLFRDRIGKTPHEALVDMRLDAAQRLLASTTLPIAEVARRTGHADQSTLTRRLRRSRGVTPGAYRRAAK